MRAVEIQYAHLYKLYLLGQGQQPRLPVGLSAAEAQVLRDRVAKELPNA